MLPMSSLVEEFRCKIQAGSHAKRLERREDPESRNSHKDGTKVFCQYCSPSDRKQAKHADIVSKVAEGARTRKQPQRKLNDGEQHRETWDGSGRNTSNGRRAKEGKKKNGKPMHMNKIYNNREEAEMGRKLAD